MMRTSSAFLRRLPSLVALTLLASGIAVGHAQIQYNVAIAASGSLPRGTLYWINEIDGTQNCSGGTFDVNTQGPLWFVASTGPYAGIMYYLDESSEFFFNSPGEPGCPANGPSPAGGIQAQFSTTSPFYPNYIAFEPATDGTSAAFAGWN
jgi:hypothetical protein